MLACWQTDTEMSAFWGRFVGWVQVCRCGWSRRERTATPGHRVAVEGQVLYMNLADLRSAGLDDV